MAFSPDGSTLAAVGEDRQIRLWDTATGQVRTTLTGHTNTVRTMRFSPDGTMLATFDADGTIRHWNVTLPTPTEAARTICQALNRDLTAEERTQYLPYQPDHPGMPSR
ncbi:hypothetical protein GCM10022245_20560 [Streptomyces mayteni]